jgi:hypothetical protein
MTRRELTRMLVLNEIVDDYEEPTHVHEQLLWCVMQNKRSCLGLWGGLSSLALQPSFSACRVGSPADAWTGGRFDSMSRQ